jgi:hypothetical protein
VLRRFLESAGNLDRRVVFLLMGLAIVIPVIRPLGLPFKVSDNVRHIYQAVAALQPGDHVLVAADFDPGSMPEVYPFLLAVYRQIFAKKGVVVITSSLWPAGPPLADAALQATAVKMFHKKYGTDYVNLGYKDGRQVAILSMGENIRSTYPKDEYGTPVDKLPAMNGINALKDFDLVVSVSSGSPGTKEWVTLVQGRYNLKMVAACTAVSAPDYIPYVQAHQLIGLAGGMAGSAEYEKLVGYKGMAAAGMDVLSVGHLLIVLAIILGNVSYFMGRRRSRSA